MSPLLPPSLSALLTPSLDWTLPGGALPRALERVHLKPPNLPTLVSRSIPKLIEPLGHIPGFRRVASEIAINYYGYAAKPRPRPLTLQGDYTTWRGLTDRTWTGRHLPPALDVSELPPQASVVDLFRRQEFRPSTDTSVLFMFFAQWF